MVPQVLLQQQEEDVSAKFFSSAMDQQGTTTNGRRDSTDEANSNNSNSCMWRRVLRPSVVLAVSSPIILIADIGLAVVFLLRQNWQGVILTSVAFIVWTQIVYWFFRARTLLQPHYQVHSDDESEAADDDVPPSYEDVIKTEAPPPSYYMVVAEGGWSSGSYSSNAHAPKDELPHRNRFSRPHHQHEPAQPSVSSGITAPYLHHITSDECTCIPATSALNDHVQVIRAPIDREISRLSVPIHKPAPARLTSRERLQADGCGALVS
ncbi:hypothetical protein O3P69_005872 [Scylla paramamosain]|uniref:Uncharacterized protein n=1 Tax=Scylla paramamosain TaxID=85552 RepID=A0AAW0U6Z4_SCYPA